MAILCIHYFRLEQWLIAMLTFITIESRERNVKRLLLMNWWRMQISKGILCNTLVFSATNSVSFPDTTNESTPKLFNLNQALAKHWRRQSNLDVFFFSYGIDYTRKNFRLGSISSIKFLQLILYVSPRLRPLIYYPHIANNMRCWPQQLGRIGRVINNFMSVWEGYGIVLSAHQLWM